jgi:hypothetical protein
LTIQIVDVYLYQANELITPLLTSKPSGVTMTNQYTQGDPNDKASLSAFRGQRRGEAVQSRPATLNKRFINILERHTLGEMDYPR